MSKAGGEKKKPRQEQWSTGQRVMVVVVGVAVVVLGVWYFYVYPGWFLGCMQVASLAFCGCKTLFT